jgi:hypothetical protein
MRRVKRLAARLLRIYRAAPKAVRRAGAEWYRKARVAAWAMAREAGVSMSTAAGVIAALSPRLQWTHNVNAARAMLLGRQVTGVFKASVVKARRIIAGERPGDVLGGPKVRAFYAALCGDDSQAVVDVWVSRAAGLRTDAPSEREYATVAQALQLAASHANVPTAHLQAAVWVEVRGRA